MKTEREKMNRLMQFYTTPSHADEIFARAAELGMTPSAYIRMAITRFNAESAKRVP